MKIRYNPFTGKLQWVSIETFLKLSDTPASYTGSENKFVRVNAGGTALEFHSGAEVWSHEDLDDMPDVGGTNTDHDARYIPLNWVEINSNQTAEVGKGYIITANARITLPATASVGDLIGFQALNVGDGDVFFTIVHPAGGRTIFGHMATVPGSPGNLYSADRGASLLLCCIIEDTVWNVVSSVGNFMLNEGIMTEESGGSGI